MSDQPFDSEKFDSDPFVRFDMPRPEQTELQQQISRSAELHRIAALNHHVHVTLNEALAALDAGDPDKALEILEKASGKYTRFGGKSPYWKHEGEGQ